MGEERRRAGADEWRCGGFGWERWGDVRADKDAFDLFGKHGKEVLGIALFLLYVSTDGGALSRLPKEVLKVPRICYTEFLPSGSETVEATCS